MSGKAVERIPVRTVKAAPRLLPGSLVALALFTLAACRSSPPTSAQAAGAYGAAVRQAARDGASGPMVAVAATEAEATDQYGPVARVVFRDTSLFDSTPLVESALRVLAAAAGPSAGELDRAGIRFVELQAGSRGPVAIVPVSRLLRYARGSDSIRQLRDTMALLGNCCPAKVTPSG